MPNCCRRLAAALTSVALASPALAHHPGGGGPGGGGNAREAGPIFTIPASTLDEGQTAVGVMFEYVRLRTLSDQTLASAAIAGNEGVHDLKTIESTSAILAYGITHDLTVSMRVPWIGRTGIREGDATDPVNLIVVDRGSSFGFGDITLLGQYRFFNDKKARTEAAVLLGVKAPTGPANRVDNQGQLFDAEFQPGTGAWNGLFGLAVTKRYGSWSLDGNVLYILSSTGTQDTNLGDRFLYSGPQRTEWHPTGAQLASHYRDVVRLLTSWLSLTRRDMRHVSRYQDGCCYRSDACRPGGDGARVQDQGFRVHPSLDA